MQKSFFTVSELADRWCVSKAHIRRMYLRGDIKATKLGRAVRISLKEIERAESEPIAASYT